MAQPVSLGRILPDQSKPTYEDLLATVLKQAAELEAAKAAKSSALSLKVSAKGALSIYGLGRFPITLYVSQFDKLALAWPDIIDFVHDNRAKFSTKD